MHMAYHYGMAPKKRRVGRPVTGRKAQLSIRLDDASLARARALAESRGLPYQLMLQNWILERLSEELRKAR